MIQYLTRRCLLIIPTLMGISLIIFLAMKMAPGDAAAIKFAAAGGDREPVDAKAIEEWRAEYLLDRPLHEQYINIIGKMITLDFGVSMIDDRRVIDKVMERLPISITLSVISIALAYIVAVPLGVLSAVKQDTFFDQSTSLLFFILYSLPNFWVAIMLMILLGVGIVIPLPWGDSFTTSVLPIYGLNSEGAENYSMIGWLLDRSWHIILPIFCLTYPSFAALSRYARNATLEVIRQDYIRTAYAKGLASRHVIFRHALRNALLPIITLLAFQLPAVLSGSVIIENIFNIPGMGQLAFESILSRDQFTIMGILTVSAFMTLLGFLLADILYSVIDPRIRFD